MLQFPNGETRVHLILGDPVAQTRSPSGLTAEFAARGVNAICVPVHVAPEHFDAFVVAAKRAQNIDGIVVTIPHKFTALGHCEEASGRAKFLGAANVLWRVAADCWRGDMTDGAATVAALRRAGCDPAGRRALVVGAGGAGSAVSLALIEAGVAALTISDVNLERRNRLVDSLGRWNQMIGAPLIVVGASNSAGCDLIVNATPAGMRPDDPLPANPGDLAQSAVVCDLITRPAMTPLLKAARERGCTVVTGEDMFAAGAGALADILLTSWRGDMPPHVADAAKSG